MTIDNGSVPIVKVATADRFPLKLFNAFKYLLLSTRLFCVTMDIKCENNIIVLFQIKK